MEKEVTTAVKLPKEIHLQLKMESVKSGESMQEIVKQAVVKELKLRENKSEK